MNRDQFARLCSARNLLRNELDAPLTIDAVARHAGMSPYHFIRRFHALFGVTPHQSRIDARVDRARELLVVGNHSVTDVCLSVGFSSLGSFSDLFAKRVGERPSAFRRRVRPMVVVPGRLPLSVAPGCLTLMADAFAILEKQRPHASGRLAACESS
jgi:transcriptional regulator GlxA family with amidase domain